MATYNYSVSNFAELAQAIQTVDQISLGSLGEHDVFTITIAPEAYLSATSIGRKVQASPRNNLLPAELIRKYEHDAFWLDPARNPYNVKVI
jgi:hypothetical protein